MNRLKLPFWLIDAFADEPYSGNAAGVVLLESDLPDAVCQKIAMEVNHPETAFLRPIEDGWSLRWFTPTKEVNLCGHATLAAASVLYDTRQIHQAKFHTRSGVLHSLVENGQVLLDFPKQPLKALALDPRVGPALFPGGVPAGAILSYWQASEDWLAELDSPERVIALVPNLDQVAQLGGRGLIATAKGGPAGIDFVSRFFAPQFGVPEDPVTGSAHCALAPFWGPRLGKIKMRGKQCSARSGIVGVELLGERVILSGQAHTTIQGTVLAPLWDESKL